MRRSDGTSLLEGGIALNRCWDELNLSRPELVGSIHAEYLDAGAEIIEANTFARNAYRIARHGLRGKVRQINLAGVRIARERCGRFGGCGQ
jgi:homocysteine S-methyltransferase